MASSDGFIMSNFDSPSGASRTAAGRRVHAIGAAVETSSVSSPSPSKRWINVRNEVAVEQLRGAAPEPVVPLLDGLARGVGTTGSVSRSWGSAPESETAMVRIGPGGGGRGDRDGVHHPAVGEQPAVEHPGVMIPGMAIEARTAVSTRPFWNQTSLRANRSVAPRP
jgi:hypothetical protein